MRHQKLPQEQSAAGNQRNRRSCTSGTCSAVDLLKNAVESMQSMADDFGIRLTIVALDRLTDLEGSIDSVNVWADADQVMQALTNLLSNAIKFSPKGATVWIQAVPQSDKVEFMIKDEGRAIPSDKLETIF